MPKLLLIALLLLCTRAGFAQRGPDKPASPDTTLPLRTTVVLSPARSTAHPPTSAVRSPATPFPPPKPALITTPALVRIYNPSTVAALANIALDWELQADGVIRQKGRIGNLTIGPRKETLIHLALRLPNGEEEIFLQVHYRLQPAGTPQSAGSAQSSQSAHLSESALPSASAHRPGSLHPSASPRAPIPDGPILAEDQILLRAAANTSLNVVPAGELSFADENDTFSIRSPTIHLAFNKQTGWLQHYQINGTDLLEDTLGLKSNFWLPAQSGDSPSRPPDSAKAWLEATRDPHLQLFSTSTGSELVIVRTEYTLPAASCLLHLSYTINATGEMLVSQQLEPDPMQKPDTAQKKPDSTQAGFPLPCFGMQWTLPPGYDSITYYGKNPDSTSWIAIYRKMLIPASAPDIHPRGTAAGTAIRWWKITGQDGRGLLITADSSLLDLSALQPPRTQPLQAPRTQPLPPSQIQLSIDYPHFDIPYASYRYAFKVSPVVTGHP